MSRALPNCFINNSINNDQFSYSNIDGKLFIYDDKTIKEKEKNKNTYFEAVEIDLNYEMILTVQNHGFVKENKENFNLRYNAYYILSTKYKCLQRVYEYLDDITIFRKGNFKDKKASNRHFFDYKDDNAINDSKIGLLRRTINDLNKYFAKYINVDFINKVGYQKDLLPNTKYGKKIRTQYDKVILQSLKDNLVIVNKTSQNINEIQKEFTMLINKIPKFLGNSDFKLYSKNIEFSDKIVPNKLNLVLLDTDEKDANYQCKEGYIIQHLSLNDEWKNLYKKIKKENPKKDKFIEENKEKFVCLKKYFIELIIKGDLCNKKITYYQGKIIPATFICLFGNKKIGYRFFKMIIKYDKTFEILELTENEISIYINYFFLKYFIKNGELKEKNIAIGLIINNNLINVFSNTTIFALPPENLFRLNNDFEISKTMLIECLNSIKNTNFTKKTKEKITRQIDRFINTELNDNKQSYKSNEIANFLKNKTISLARLESAIKFFVANNKTTFQDIQTNNCIDFSSYFMDYFKSKYKYIVSVDDVKQFFYEYIHFDKSYKCYQKEIMDEIMYSTKIKNELNKKIYEKTGFYLVSSGRAKNMIDETYGPLIDYNFSPVKNNTLYYVAGTLCDDIKNKNFHTANLFKKVIAPDNIANNKIFFFDEMREYLYVPFIRSSGLTVWPFPFKYLREYYNMLIEKENHQNNDTLIDI